MAVCKFHRATILFEARNRGDVRLTNGSYSQACVGECLGSCMKANKILAMALDDVGQIYAVAKAFRTFLPGFALIDRDGNFAGNLQGHEQSVATTGIVDSPRFVVRGRRADDVGSVELEGDVVVRFVDDSLAIVAVLEIWFVDVDRICVPRLARIVAGAVM